MRDKYDHVQVKNRITDAPTEVMYEGCVHVWQPGEVRAIPREDAPFFISHSRYLWNAMLKVNKCRLVILGSGEDESDLTNEQATPPEILDRTNMPPTVFDAQGNPLTQVEYKDVSRVPVPEPRAEAPLEERTVSASIAAY